MGKHESRSDMFAEHREAGVVGVAVQPANHGPPLLVPETELAKIDNTARRPEAFEDFNWATDPAVVLTEQPATAVYFNSRGALVIRQEKAWDEEIDPTILIAPNNIQEFIDKLTDVLGIPGAPQ